MKFESKEKNAFMMLVRKKLYKVCPFWVKMIS